MTRTLFKWLLRALGGLVALVVAGAILAYYLAAHSLPDYATTHDIADVPGEVEIVRDNYAVPHVFAEDDLAVFYGLGFAHAQDRLWQMTMNRRVAQGRLAEMFGPSVVETDHLLRALDIYGVAGRNVARLRPEIVAELEAYADGVNAYLRLIQTEALGRGAPEFFLFEPQIAPWTPTDSVAILKLFALQLSDAAKTEVMRAQLSLRIAPERVNDILPQSPQATMELPEYSGALELPPWQAAAVAPPTPHSPLAPWGMAGASNVFAAAPARAAAGSSILASDPHLGLAAPGPLYLARLDLSTGSAIGATVPGLPAILIGRTGSLAWGVTASYLDDQDVFIEKLGDNPDTYLTPDGPRAFDERQSVIQVAGGAPRTVTLRWTRHGPVIPSPHFNAASVTPSGHVAALAWTALDPEDTTTDGAMSLMRQSSVADALPLLDRFHAPAMNLALADPETVTLRAIGRAPARGPGNASQGRIPLAGWAAANDWRGYLRQDDNPAVESPGGGIVVNTNNRTTEAPYPKHWSFDWGDAHRIQRAERMLNARAFHTLDSFIEAQTDVISPAARSLLPLIAKNLWYQGEPAAQNTVDRKRQIALEALASWNGEMSQHAPEPLIFAAWLRSLQRRLVIDDLGPLTESFARPDPLFLERVFRDVDGASAWCDIRQSDAVETCEEVARLALDDALITLAESYGTRVESWRWGAAHEAVHKHPVLGDQASLDWLVNIRQETGGGDSTLMRGRMSATGDTPFRNVHAAVYRMVVDMADPDASLYILSTGQSGHPLSRHYDDQALLWRRNEYIPMSLDPATARGGSVGITTLRPAASD